MRRAFLLTAVVAAVALVVPAADAATGTLTQLGGRGGCLAYRTHALRGCGTIRLGGHQIVSVATSPDGRNAYGAALGGSIGVFRIGRNGSLHQLGGRRGCLSVNGRLGCARVAGLSGGWKLTVSPDGRNVYLSLSRGVFVFARDRRSGALTPLPGKRRCISEQTSARCALGRALFGLARSLVVSPDGRSVYQGSWGNGGGGVAIFSRNRASGELHQLPGTAGCIEAGGAEGCTAARAVYGGDCCGVAITRGSRGVYVSSTKFVPGGSNSPTSANFGLAAFSRDASSGALTQLPGAAGCISEVQAEGCSPTGFRDSGVESEAGGVSVSPDGRHVYVAHLFTFPEAEAGCGASYGASFQRSRATGALGLLEQDVPACGPDLTMSPDGANLYTLDSFASVVVVLGRPGGVWQRVGCFAQFFDRCRRPRGVGFFSQLAIAPNGRNAYLTSDSAIAVLERRT